MMNKIINKRLKRPSITFHKYTVKQGEKRAVVKRRVLIHCIRRRTIHLPTSLSAAIEGTACVFCTRVNACVITLHFIGLKLRCKEQQPAGHPVMVTCVSHLYLVEVLLSLCSG